MCDLKEEQERKSYSLTVMYLCVKLTRDQLWCLVLCHIGLSWRVLKWGNLSIDKMPLFEEFLLIFYAIDEVVVMASMGKADWASHNGQASMQSCLQVFALTSFSDELQCGSINQISPFLLNLVLVLVFGHGIRNSNKERHEQFSIVLFYTLLDLHLKSIILPTFSVVSHFDFSLSDVCIRLYHCGIKLYFSYYCLKLDIFYVHINSWIYSVKYLLKLLAFQFAHPANYWEQPQREGSVPSYISLYPGRRGQGEVRRILKPLCMEKTPKQVELT